MAIWAFVVLTLGVLVALLAIAGLAAAHKYQPTVFTQSAPDQPVTGWRRSVALVVLSPMISIALLLRAAGLLKTVDEREPRSMC